MFLSENSRIFPEEIRILSNGLAGVDSDIGLANCPFETILVERFRNVRSES